MKNLTIIGLAGKRGSGKGFTVEILTSYYTKNHVSVSTFKFSDVLSVILDTAHIEKKQSNYNELFLSLNKIKPDFMSEILEKKIKESSGILLIDGVRHIDQVEIIKKYNGSIIYIEAEDEKRYAKVIERKEKSGDIHSTYEDFKRDEENGANKNIDLVKDLADTIISNTYNEDFKEIVEKIGEDFYKR